MNMAGQMYRGAVVQWMTLRSRSTDRAGRRDLIPKSRLYVHLSSDMETAKKVGSRHGRPVIYKVDCKQMSQDGYRFYASGETLCMVIALGYGETQGSERKSKSVEDVVISKGTMPDWFRKGVEPALKAPTAVNQQKFAFGVKDGEPAVRIKGMGMHTRVDLGIVAYHFEAASGKKITAL